MSIYIYIYIYTYICIIYTHIYMYIYVFTHLLKDSVGHLGVFPEGLGEVGPDDPWRDHVAPGGRDTPGYEPASGPLMA